MLRVYILLYNILHNYLYVRRDSTELNVRCMLECTMYCTIYKSNKKKSDTISSSRGVSRDSAYLYVRHDSRSHSGMHLMSSLIQYVFIRFVDINTIRIYTYCRHQSLIWMSHVSHMTYFDIRCMSLTTIRINTYCIYVLSQAWLTWGMTHVS